MTFTSPTNLPSPMRVRDRLITEARNRIDPPLKRIYRVLIRRALMRKHGILELGEGFHWGNPLILPYRACRIGDLVYIGAHGSIIAPITIGDMTLISTHVKLVGDDHAYHVPGLAMRLAPRLPRKITIIESECWVGKGAILKEGIVVGRGSIIAAGAVVTRDVPRYAIVAGVPARQLKMRFTPEEMENHELALYEP